MARELVPSPFGLRVNRNLYCRTRIKDYTWTSHAMFYVSVLLLKLRRENVFVFNALFCLTLS